MSFFIAITFNFFWNFFVVILDYVRKYANEDVITLALSQESMECGGDDGNESDSTISDYSEGKNHYFS